RGGIYLFAVPTKPGPKPASWAAQPPATRPLKIAGPSIVPSRPALPLMWPPAMPATSPAAYRPGIGSKERFNTRQRRSAFTPRKFFLANRRSCLALYGGPSHLLGMYVDLAC